MVASFRRLGWIALSLGACSGRTELTPGLGRGGDSSGGASANAGGAQSNGGTAGNGNGGKATSGSGGTAAGGERASGGATNVSAGGGADAGAGAGGAIADAGAGSAGADGACTVAQRVEVERDPFGTNLRLDPVQLGDGRFALIAWDTAANTFAALAVVSWEGIESKSQFTLNAACPGAGCAPPLLGAAALASGDESPQLLLIDRGPGSPTFTLRAEAWRLGDATALAFTPLFSADVRPQTSAFAVKNSLSGNLALFAFGNRASSAEITVAAISAGARLIAAPETFSMLSNSWNCVEVIPTIDAGAISVVSRADATSDLHWHIEELNSAAQVTFSEDASIPGSAGVNALDPSNCPQVVQTDTGYTGAWPSADASVRVASVSRLAPEAPPSLRVLGARPGQLVGALGANLLFQSAADSSGAVRFLQLTPEGAPIGLAFVLSALPPSSADRYFPPPKVLGTQGRSFYLSYETDSARVFAQIHCP